MCGGTGWRLFMIDTNGDRRVCRCECRGPYTASDSRRMERQDSIRTQLYAKGPGQTAQIVVVDYKSLAAGEQ